MLFIDTLKMLPGSDLHMKGPTSRTHSPVAPIPVIKIAVLTASVSNACIMGCVFAVTFVS